MAKQAADTTLQRFFAQQRALEERVLNGSLDPVAIRQPLQDIIQGKLPTNSRFDRYASLLVSAFDWLAVLRRYNEQYWDNRFIDEDFARAEAQLASVPSDHVQGVDNLFGFHVEGDSFRETFEMWYRVYQGELNRHFGDDKDHAWRWPELNFDAQHFNLHELAHVYERGIHLVNINLVAHWEPEDGRTLVEVREQAKSQSEILAQLEVISIYGVLIELFMQQDGENLPYSDMPGTVVTAPGDSGPDALFVGWYRYDREAEFDASWVDYRDRHWAAPVLRELQH